MLGLTSTVCKAYRSSPSTSSKKECTHSIHEQRKGTEGIVYWDDDGYKAIAIA